MGSLNGFVVVVVDVLDVVVLEVLDVVVLDVLDVVVLDVLEVVVVLGAGSSSGRNRAMIASDGISS